MKQKNILYIIICTLFVLSGLYSCIDDPEFDSGVHNAGEPEISEVVIIDKDKTASTVTLKSSVLKANGYPVTDRGFMWNTDSVIPEDNEDLWLQVGEGIGEYTDTIKNLTPGVKYFFWSYAINKEGSAYSPDYDSISTNSGLGKLNVFVPEEYIRATSAIVSGKITLKGEGKTKSRGVYYSESPVMEDKKMVKSETPFDQDSFVCNLSGLKPETDYYALAFVENEISDATIITLSDTIDFKTGDGKPIVEKELYIKPGYDNVYVESRIVSQGDAPLDERGFCWSTTEDHPTIEDDTRPLGKEEGEFSANIEGLIPEQKYYIRAYGSNKFGTSYSDPKEFSMLKDLPTLQTLEPSSDYDAGEVYVNGLIEDDGKSDILYKGFCFTHRVPVPDLGNTNDNEKVYIRTTGDDFSYTISGLKGGTKYYIRAFATNNEGTSYGVVKEIITPDILKVSSDEFRGLDRLSGSSAYFVIRDKGYLLGGDKGTSYTDELWSFNPVTQSWQGLSPYPEAAKGQSAVVYGINVYALGGMTPGNVYLDDFRRYRSSSTINNWDNRTKGPDPAYSRVGVISEDIAWFVGGMGDTLKNEVWNYHFTSDMWVRKPDFPVKQFGGIALNIDGQIYAGLGKDISEVCNNTIWELNGDLSSWTQETNNSLIDGGVLAGVTYNNKIYLIDDSFYIHEYDILSKTWTRKSRINGSERDVHGMFVINEKMYIGLINNRMYQYNPLWDN